MSRNRPFQGPAGFIIEPYPIGLGSFGEVYLAKRPPRSTGEEELEGDKVDSSSEDKQGRNDSALNATETVAIKRISDFSNVTQLHCADREPFLRRICREVANLKHFSDCPHIVEIQDIYLSDDKLDLYMVMTAYSLSLEQLFSNPGHTQIKENLKEGHIRWMMCQVLCGLYEIHIAGCMHRDLTLSNLLIDLESFETVISDFGLSRVQLEADPMISLTVASLPYRAPEIILESRPYTNSVDIWSAGCILVQLLSKSSIMRIGGEQEDVVAQLWTIMETVCGLPTETELVYWEEKRGAAKKIVAYLRVQRQRAERAKVIRGMLETRPGKASDSSTSTAAATSSSHEPSTEVLEQELAWILSVTPRFPEKRDIGEELTLECSKNADPTPPSEEAIDVARRMLLFDPEQRASAKELLEMPWFQNDEACRNLILATFSNDPVVATDETEKMDFEEMLTFVRQSATL